MLHTKPVKIPRRVNNAFRPTCTQAQADFALFLLATSATQQECDSALEVL